MSFCHVQVEDIVWTDVDERHEIATEYWISKSKGNRLCNNQSFRYLQTKLKNPSISTVFWKKSFLNVVQKCFQHVEGVSSKYPKISRKNLAKEYWVLKRAKDKISGLLWKRKDFLSSFAIMSFCHVQVEEIPWTDVDERHEMQQNIEYHNNSANFFPRGVCWITQKFHEHETKATD